MTVTTPSLLISAGSVEPHASVQQFPTRTVLELAAATPTFHSPQQGSFISVTATGNGNEPRGYVGDPLQPRQQHWTAAATLPSMTIGQASQASVAERSDELHQRFEIIFNVPQDSATIALTLHSAPSACSIRVPINVTQESSTRVENPDQVQTPGIESKKRAREPSANGSSSQTALALNMRRPQPTMNCL